jgi:hypothetical protein
MDFRTMYESMNRMNGKSGASRNNPGRRVEITA